MMFLSSGVITQINAQLQCGMSTVEQSYLNPDDSPVFKARSEKVYIPIQFYLFADADGTGALDVGSLLNEITSLNKIFDPIGFYFYLANHGDIPTMNHSDLFSRGPGGYDDVIEAIRSFSAVNVFVSRNLYSGDNQVAGYYSPSRDIVAMNGSYIDNEETLAHELGHFFSLPHTFYGWEDDPYSVSKHGNPVNITQAPSYGVPVELVDQSNCTKSGDKICDTPPDYNFGAARSGCVYNTIVRDPNGDTIPIMENNYMSYFANCADFMFTQGQQNAMNNNYLLPRRDYFRLDYVPQKDNIKDLVTLVAPATNQKIETFNYVVLEWEPVTNATRYYIEITDGRELTKVIASGTSYTFTTLKANKTYVIKIRPFSEGYTDTKNKISTFRTGNLTTATTELTGSNRYLKVYPNPVTDGSQIKVEVNAGSNGDYKLEVFNMLGQAVLSQKVSLDFGVNTITLDQLNTQAGVHFVRIHNEKYDLKQKFIIGR